MTRREFIALMGASVTWPVAAMAQEPGRNYRLGGVSPSERNAPWVVAMLDELQRQGFIVGQNLTVEWRVYGSRVDLIPEFMAELLKAPLDAILTGGDVGIRAAQQATAAIPILGVTEDMVGQGLVKSLARPGGHTTGVSILANELDGKRLEILIEAVPGLRRMAVLADSKRPSRRSFRHCRAQHAHEALRFRFIRLQVPMRSRQLSTRRRRLVRQR